MSRRTLGILIPLALSIVAMTSAGFLAYGANPDLARFERGLGWIMLARRLLWVMVGISLVCSISLIVMVIGGHIRAWWLIALAPVLALFTMRFGPGQPSPAYIVESPVFVNADNLICPEDGEFVVGVVFEGQSYAFPYRALFVSPVVIVTDYDKRMLLMWSAYANRAMAFQIARELKARDLEVVSSPANSLLVYDRRLGRFVSGVTAQLAAGGKFNGLGARVTTQKLTWAAWKNRFPQTRVMISARDSRFNAAPSQPVAPTYRMPVIPGPDVRTPVALIATTQPIAIVEDMPIVEPLNLLVGNTSLLLVRNERTLRLRAFERRVGGDLFPRFSRASSRKFPDAVMSDSDSNSLWTQDGVAIDGELKGEKLTELSIETGLYWGVMKYWYPDLQLIDPSPTPSVR